MKLDPEFISALQEIEITQGVSREVIFESLREAICTAYYKTNGPVDNLVVEVDLKDGNEIEAYLKKRVALDVIDPACEIAIGEAKAVSEDAEEGDFILVEVSLESLSHLAVHHARLKIINAIKDSKRTRILENYNHRVSEIVNGSVRYVDRRDVYLDVGEGVEAILPYEEQIPTERYHTGQRIKAILIEVRSARKVPMLILSRTHPDLIRRLMENEIPEVREKAIEVVAIARDPGYRAKVAVRSNRPELDAVGTCIGSKGIRILAISHELHDEKIDLIPFKEDAFEYIAEALSPAKVQSVEIFEDERKTIVIVPNDQISLAIGKGWRNVKLASKLTKYYLDVKSVKEMEDEEVARNPEAAKKAEADAGEESDTAAEAEAPLEKEEASADSIVADDDVSEPKEEGDTGGGAEE